ncbi:SH3 domain-containing protein [bacterium]|nr:SH3 domain-containing protein [bacterium]
MMRSKRLQVVLSLLLLLWTTGIAGAQNASMSVLAVVINRDVPLYHTPNGDVVQTLARGTLVNATGQDADGAWIRVEIPDLADGWIETVQLVVVGAEVLPTVTAHANQGTVAKTAAARVTVTKPGPSSAKTDADKDNAGSSTTTSTTTSTTEETLVATVNSGNARLNVRSGPGTSYAIVAKAETGERYPVKARDTSRAWLQVQLDEESSAFGWVSAQFVRLDGDVADLPVSVAGR